MLQLLVPVLAAAGGVLLASEPLSLRLVLASAAVLGGILMVILAGGAEQRLSPVCSGELLNSSTRRLG